MYEDTQVSFNWKSLIIKLVIIAIILILIVLLFPLIVKKDNDYSAEFKSNVSKLKDVGTNYFNNDNLPKNVGDSIKVNLKELVTNNKIEDLKVNGKTCNSEKSYIKVVKKSVGYELESTLVCGEEENTSYTYLGCMDTCEDVTTTSSKTTTTTTTTTVRPTTNKSTTVTTTTKPTTTTTVRYAVIFNRNMGSDVETVYVVKGGYVSKPKNPVRSGYRFVGWYYNDSLFDFNNSIDKNIVLIAKWERI